MRALSIVIVALASTVVASEAFAENVAIPLGAVQLLTNPDGRVRLVLPASTPELPRNIALGGARLRLPGIVLSDFHDLRIHVRAVSGPWGGAGEVPTYEGLVGRLNLPRGAVAREIDLTNLVRGLGQEDALLGLLITVPEGSGDGFDAADAPALLADFQQAAFEISFRRIPPPPVRRRG